MKDCNENLIKDKVYKTNKGYEIAQTVDGYLYLKGPCFSDNTYAFYIFQENDIEKKFYTSENFYKSKKKLSEGFYLLSFFRKDSSGNKHRDNIEVFYLENHGFIGKEGLCLAETEHYLIRFYPQKSNKLFIVFNGAGSLKNTQPFGLRFLLKKGYNVIACNQNDDQYQNLSYESFKEIITPYLANKEVYLYGSSLGGYCAVYYAGAVNGTIIAAAPRNSVHPEMIKRRVQTIYSESAFKHKEIKENHATDKNVYIFVDPLVEEDMFFIDSFIKPVYPGLTLIRAPYGGHQVLYHINKTGKLSEIISEVVEKDVVSTLLIDGETEFTSYNKILSYDQKITKELKKIKKMTNVNSVISKKLDSFFSKYK